MLKFLRSFFSPPPADAKTKQEDEDDDAPFDPPHDFSEAQPMPIEDAIDLHTFSPRESASVVEEYLYEAQARGFREVRIIHGKGKGVQRQIIQKVLARHPAVEAFADAPPERGGWGATVARLKGGD